MRGRSIRSHPARNLAGDHGLSRAHPAFNVYPWVEIEEVETDGLIFAESEEGRVFRREVSAERGPWARAVKDLPGGNKRE